MSNTNPTTATTARLRPGACRRTALLASVLTTRLAWRRCLVYSGLFLLPASTALAQSTQQVIVAGSNLDYGTGAASRNVLLGPQSWSGAATDRQTIIPDAGTVSGLRVVLEFAPGNGKSVTFTLRRDTGAGPVATALTCTVAGLATSCADTVNSVAVAAGNKLDLQATPAAVPTAGHVHYSTRYVSTTAKRTLLLGSSPTSPLNYISLHAAGTHASEFAAETVFPAAGTLRRLYVDLPTAPGAGESRTFTVRKNGAPTALTCTIAGAATSCSDTVNSVSFAVGDTAALEHTPSASPAAVTRSSNGVVFEASTPGGFLIAMGTDQPLSTVAPRFSYVSTGNSNVQALEGERNQLAQQTTIKTLYVEMDPAPDNGAGVNGYQFKLRRNGADTGLLCSISESATTCNAGLDVAIANDDLLSLEITPSNSPAPSTAFHASFCAGDRPGSCPPVLTTTGATSVGSGALFTLDLKADLCTPTSWTINWGDGAVVTYAGNPASVTHTYTAAMPSIFSYNILASAVCGGRRYFQNELVVGSAANDKLNWYVDDPTTNKAVVRAPTQSGPDAGLNYPLDPIIGPDGNLYVSGLLSGNVVRYNPTTGAFIDQFATGGTAASGMAFGPDGHLYVGDATLRTVRRYNGTTGAFIDNFVTAGLGGIVRPEGLIFGPDGNLYVTDFSSDTVRRYNGSTGASMGVFISGTAPRRPEDLVFGPDGNLYVASDQDHKVLRYNGTTGAYINDFVTAGSGGMTNAQGVSFGPDGNLYVSSWQNDNVLRYNGTTGAFIDVYVSAGLGGLNTGEYMDFLPGHQVKVLSLTAVELVSFTATGLNGAVGLSWETGSEIRNLGFHVYRSMSESGPWERLTASLIPGLGSSPEGARYGYVDAGLVNGQGYFYLLEDVETTGATQRHGPVSATPTAAAAGGDGDEAGADDPTQDAASWVRYGNPEASALRVVSRGERHAVLELTTGGFYALPQDDGSVLLQVPGFDSLDSPGAPDLPVRRTWLDAIAGRQVEIGNVRVREVESFATLRPADAGVPEALVYSDGTIRAGRRAAKKRFRGAGLYPEAPASLLEVGFQGELKKALVELAPLRWDAASGQLLLARRLEVTVSFEGRAPGERGLGGARGRKGHEDRKEARGGEGLRPVDEARVVAYLSASTAGPYAASFEELLPGQRRALRTTSLRLSRHGEDVPFHVLPDPSRFGPGSSLHFVSPGPADNPDATAAVYALEAGVSGTLMAVRDARPSGQALASGDVGAVFESDKLYMAALVEAPDLWLWDVVVAPGAKSYPFSLDGVVPGLAGRLQLDMVGATDTAQDPDHHVRVSVNGVLVADVWWDGKRPYRVDAEVPPGVLVEGSNSLEIHDTGDTGASVSGVWLDRFEVGYSRALFATSGSIEASFGVSGQALFSGVGSGALVFDLSDPETPAWLTGGQWTGTALAVRAEAGQRLLAAAAAGHPGVRLAGSVAALRDTTTSYDYVAVGPREFLAAAEPLLQWRRDEGLSVLEVAVEDVYDAFSGGEIDPAAIRDFLAFAYHEWPAPPRYVLLLGDASYDGKGRLGYPDRNRVPPFMLETPYMWTLSDAAYAAVNGDDDLADIAIGRLPAANVEEARRLALKVLARERDGYRFDDATAVLVADNADHAGDFPRDVEEIAATLLAGRDVEVLRLDRLGKATRGAIHDAFDRGAGIVSYFGHGALALWASENVFNNGDVNTLAPQPQQPLLLTMNCLNGYILHPLLDSLAESLLKAEGRGAVAAFSPASLSVNQSARRYHDALLDEVLSGRHERLGDAFVAAQARYAGEGALPDILASYLLLADPATRLR